MEYQEVYMIYNDLFLESDLPKALNKQQIYEYFLEYKKGDSSARDAIINHNIRLVLYRVGKKFSKFPYDQQELISMGLIGLIKSVDTFDIDKNINFATYAIRCIDNEILMFVRKEQKHLPVDSLDKVIINDADGSELKIENKLEDDNIHFVEDYEDTEEKKILRNIVNELPEQEREIIILYFGFKDNRSYTQKEIAQICNISQSYASRLIKKTVKKIGTEFKSYYEKYKADEVQIISEKKSKKKKTENSQKGKLKNIYEYFRGYSKEEVNCIIKKLDEEDIKFLQLEYGNGLEKLVNHEKWPKEKADYFYELLIPRMKELLQDSTRENVKSSIILQEKNKITKDDYINFIEMIKTPLFSQMKETLGMKEASIISLEFGYIDGKYFSTETIADFLEIEQEEVIQITRKVLVDYQMKFNQALENIIETIDNEALILNKKTVILLNNNDFGNKYK